MRENEHSVSFYSNILVVRAIANHLKIFLFAREMYIFQMAKKWHLILVRAQTRIILQATVHVLDVTLKKI